MLVNIQPFKLLMGCMEYNQASVRWNKIKRNFNMQQRAMWEEESARMKYILSFFLVMLGLLVKFKGFLELGFHTEGDKEARIRDGP